MKKGLYQDAEKIAGTIAFINNLLSFTGSLSYKTCNFEDNFPF